MRSRLQSLLRTVPSLINQLKESRSEKRLGTLGNEFEKHDLVIAVELGYISFDKEGSELLFTHLSLRAGRKSTIITTNLSFERWNQIFLDPGKAGVRSINATRGSHHTIIPNNHNPTFRFCTLGMATTNNLLGLVIAT